MLRDVFCYFFKKKSMHKCDVNVKIVRVGIIYIVHLMCNLILLYVALCSLCMFMYVYVVICSLYVFKNVA